MRFNVPQYITIEDKLIGLITFRQLFLLLGAFFISFISYKILPSFIALIMTFIAFAVAAALGWIQMNGKPLLNQIPKIFEYLFSFAGKRYLWRPSQGITTKSIEIPIIVKYFPIDELEEEIDFVKKTPFQKKEIPEIKQKLPARKTIITSVKKTSEVGFDVHKSQPLIRYIQYSHKHKQNPFNPYRNFPLPHFPISQQ